MIHNIILHILNQYIKYKYVLNINGLTREKTMRKNIFNFIIFSILMSLSPSVMAHIGTGTAEGGGFIAGFNHPLLGLDHLLAMLAVGLWAGQNQGKILFAAPLTFIALMTVGGI
jgi:hydrogenase/urease accessory protein HupE